MRIAQAWWDAEQRLVEKGVCAKIDYHFLY
jgi:hypothetical protein